MRLLRGLLAAAFLLLFTLPAQAKLPVARAKYNLTALAMTGKPHEAEGFTHLDYANPDAPKGGALSMARSGSFDSLNPYIIFGNPAAELELTADKLMQRGWNEPFTLYGLVAESIDVSDDRSEITFHLNPEARFHDGTPMTAEDVKFSFEALRDYGLPVRRHVYGLVKKAWIISPREIRFVFGEGYSREDVMILALMPVLPKHYWQKHDISKTTLDAPLGSGPYRIAGIDAGRKIVYERVKDYWAKDLPVNKGMYNFDTITVYYYRDENAALAAFGGGAYDVRQEYDISRWVRDYDLAGRKLSKREIPYARPEAFRGMIFNTRRDVFKDRRVREALSLMFDFDWINRNLFYGQERRIASLFPNSELAPAGAAEGAEKEALLPFRDELPPEVFGASWTPPEGDMRSRTRKAAALLKEAGWVYRDEKLVNAKTGAAFSFEILSFNAREERVALAFARDLKRIGVEARVRTVDLAQFTGRLDAFDYDMVIHQWVNSLSPGNEQTAYWSAAAGKMRGGRNYAGIDSRAVDALAASIGASEDRETLVARARALDRAVMWGYYVIPFYYLGRDLVAYDTDIHMPEASPVYGIEWKSWWRGPR